jgi:hypothetical protein
MSKKPKRPAMAAFLACEGIALGLGDAKRILLPGD